MDGAGGIVPERTFGVAELSTEVSRALAAALPGDVWVKGQVRSLRRTATGAVYFDLAEPGPLGAA
ncbi:MAG: exodeoxyribonuclease VII large subunit, partial [Actinobacteria bacterium]|nr:exodeoxyribonuclease VII large subunit [Actinomycetota bacterium]